jgi:CheY-like chemotaxis protein
VRVVIADDSRLLREGIASLVRGEGIDVVAQAATADELLAAVDEHEPDVAIVAIRVPPTRAGAPPSTRRSSPGSWPIRSVRPELRTDSSSLARGRRAAGRSEVDSVSVGLGGAAGVGTV